MWAYLEVIRPITLLSSFCLVEANGRAQSLEPIPGTPDQVASICYTSVRT
jgi:hypothetical protein